MYINELVGVNVGTSVSVGRAVGTDVGVDVGTDEGKGVISDDGIVVGSLDTGE